MNKYGIMEESRKLESISLIISNSLEFSFVKNSPRVVFHSLKILACPGSYNWDILCYRQLLPRHFTLSGKHIFCLSPQGDAFESTEFLSLFLSVSILRLHNFNWFNSWTIWRGAGRCQSYRVDVISEILNWNWIHYIFHSRHFHV